MNGFKKDKITNEGIRIRTGCILIISIVSLTLLTCGTPYDLLIKDCTVYDGSGNPGYKADVAIRADRISKIKRSIHHKSHQIISEKGKVLSPGFIDLHAHIETITAEPLAKSHVMQGVTTALGGPDGGSPFPLGEYLDSLQKLGTGINVAYLIGHGTIRNHTMGLVDRQPTPQELNQMISLVDQAMQDGAFGMSTGLKYVPGAFAETEEIIELTKRLQHYKGIYTSHLREEGLGLIDAVAEAINIGKATGVPVVLTHHKAIGQAMWGASSKTLKMVDEAVGQGLEIWMDQYPYTASQTGISIVCPSWSMEGGIKEFIRRCEDPELKDSIRDGIIYNLKHDRGGNDLRRIQFSKMECLPHYEGKTLKDLVTDSGLEANLENGANKIIEILQKRGASCIFHVIDSVDVINIMKHPRTMIASDGSLNREGAGHPHPRSYGTFPRVLGYYCRELGVLDLPLALHKMTGLPAKLLGLNDRGVIRKGAAADLVIFDPNTIRDQSTYLNPHQYPTGISYVVINGKLAIKEGIFLNERTGKILRRRE